MQFNTDTIGNINNQIAELQLKKQSLINADREQKLTQVKAIIIQYGFTANDLGLSTKRKSTKPFIRYINPENPSETWVGRGRKPDWIATYLEMGGKLADVKALKPIRKK
jgi:DNA-binding protein H-NS